MILDCDVLQADGGTRTASITGAYVALALALRQLVKYGALKTIPHARLRGGHQRGDRRTAAPMLDLCYEEDSQADVDMNVVMTGAGKFVEVQATAEKTAFDDAQMAANAGAGAAGIGELVAIQKTVRRQVTRLLRTPAIQENCGSFSWRAPDFEVELLPRPVTAAG